MFRSPPGASVERSDVNHPDPQAPSGLTVAGDVLLQFAGRDVESLRGYSETLKRLEPGQTVSVTLRRDEEELSLQATLALR